MLGGDNDDQIYGQVVELIAGVESFSCTSQEVALEEEKGVKINDSGS